MTSVLVSHPHVAAVSAGLAASLSEQDRLAAVTAGVVFSDRGWAGHLAARLADTWPTLRNRIVPGIPPSRVRAHPAVELAARTSSRVFGGLDPHLSPYNALFLAHDLAVSWSRWPTGTTAVYAYEDGALWTFRRARRQGVERLWDLPTPHHRVAQRTFAEESARWPDAVQGPPHREPDWKLRRKDAELALANQIVVASRFTRRSIEELAGDVPVVVAPYGFPVELFPPRSVPPPGRFRVLAVGSHDVRKGTPYLLEAWKQAALREAELHLVGPLRLAKPFLDRYAGLFHHTPHVPRRELAAHYAAADLLAFPTLADGFGLVIQEAMCSGTPVLTTPNGGGPECITDGADGWIVPPRDIEALVVRLREAAANRDRLHAMGKAARARAERFTWREAGRAVIDGLKL